MRARWMLGLGLMGLAVGGCLETEGESPGQASPETVLGPAIRQEQAYVPWNLTDPAEVVEAHIDAIGARALKPYRKNLTEDFEFYPRSEDVDDLPWMTGVSWSRSDELGMMSNLFAPPLEPGTTPPAVAVEASYQVLNARDLGDGQYEWTIDFEVLVLWNENTGVTSESRLVIGMVTGDDDVVRIREIQEFQALGSRVETASWGLIKALYR